MAADNTTNPLEPSSAEGLDGYPDDSADEKLGTEPTLGTHPASVDVDLDPDIDLNETDKPQQGEIISTQTDFVEATDSNGNSETAHRWWYDGPKPWISKLLLTEVVTAVVIGLLFLGVTEIRENERQQRAEQLEGERQQRAEQLENLRFVRTSIADPEEKQSRQFSGFDLAETDLTGLDLSRANFFGADLSRANFFGADLSRAKLNGANLEGAHLEGVNLSKADLREANLEGVNLEGADLTGANFTGADLTGANLLHVGTFLEVNLTGVVWDDSTVWPEGFTPPN